jgi:glycosyltransferase involved in cell wall biosynthesis
MVVDHRRLSVGLPVYNGETYIREALESIVSQTYESFELIISDNASTDDTQKICEEYASKDKRIRYYRSDENLGAAWNFNRVFELATGKYFKWATYDDLLDPVFFAKCVSVLDDDASVILCYSNIARIDGSGRGKGSYGIKMKVDNPDLVVRFSDLVLIRHRCIELLGVIRREVLEKTPLIGNFIGSDRNLLAELGLRGRFYAVPEYLFIHRDHSESTFRKYTLDQRLKWFDPNKKVILHLPNWRNGVEYLRSVNRVPMTWEDRVRCYLVIIRWVRSRRRNLLQDLRDGIRKIHI